MLEDTKEVIKFKKNTTMTQCRNNSKIKYQNRKRSNIDTLSIEVHDPLTFLALVMIAVNRRTDITITK
jgi:hypothetical protein